MLIIWSFVVDPDGVEELLRIPGPQGVILRMKDSTRTLISQISKNNPVSMDPNIHSAAVATASRRKRSMKVCLTTQRRSPGKRHLFLPGCVQEHREEILARYWVLFAPNCYFAIDFCVICCFPWDIFTSNFRWAHPTLCQLLCV